MEVASTNSGISIYTRLELPKNVTFVEVQAACCHEKSIDIVCIGAKTQDIGRLAYRDIGRKNPRPYKLINKAVHTEPVL